MDVGSGPIDSWKVLLDELQKTVDREEIGSWITALEAECKRVMEDSVPQTSEEAVAHGINHSRHSDNQNTELNANA